MARWGALAAEGAHPMEEEAVAARQHPCSLPLQWPVMVGRVVAVVLEAVWVSNALVPPQAAHLLVVEVVDYQR